MIEYLSNNLKKKELSICINQIILIQQLYLCWITTKSFYKSIYQSSYISSLLLSNWSYTLINIKFNFHRKVQTRGDKNIKMVKGQILVDLATLLRKISFP